MPTPALMRDRCVQWPVSRGSTYTSRAASTRACPQGARAAREDVQDQLAAVEHLDARIAARAEADLLLEVALLRRCERIVEHHHVGLELAYQVTDLVDLALADERPHVGHRAALRGLADDGDARRPAQLRQLGERALQALEVLARATELDAAQQRARGR